MKTSQARIKDILATMEYGPAPESTDVAMNWLDQHGRRFDHFIDGAFVAPTDGAHFDVVNPADESLLAQVAQGSECIHEEQLIDRAQQNVGTQPAGTDEAFELAQ